MKEIIDTIAQLEKQKAEWLKKVESIDITIQTLKQSLGYNTNGITNGGSFSISNGKIVMPSNEQYDKNASMKSKIQYFLKSEQRFLHISEMADIAHALETNISSEDWQLKISPALSALKRDGKIVNTTIGKSLRNTFWGVSKWLDDSGQIKREHMYNENLLVEANTEKFEV